ncbi:MAG: hypothetical protein F4233_08255 [Rhodospirillaceae bacterium]|nr:hypothetical protein [Rhodospirillaceae bacterium]
MRKQRNVKINPVCKTVRKTVADGPQYFVSGRKPQHIAFRQALRLESAKKHDKKTGLSLFRESRKTAQFQEVRRILINERSNQNKKIVGFRAPLLCRPGPPAAGAPASGMTNHDIS